VEIPELKLGKEHDHPVVTAQEIREEAEPVEAAAEGAAPAEGAAAAAPAAAAPAPAEKK